MSFLNKRSFLYVLMLQAVSLPALAESFVVHDVQVEGLQSLPRENVAPFLKVKSGDTFTPDSSDVLIRSLFKSGYFDDIQLIRQPDDVLQVQVVERPIIAAMKFSGNQMIKKEDIEKVLSKASITTGNVFNPQSLKQVVDSLKREYQSRGRYALRVDVATTALPRNRIEIELIIHEGKTAKIERIQFIGNEVFSDQELKDTLTLTTPGFFTFFTGTDLFAEPKFQESIQHLTDFYLDRGYLDFRILSQQVSLSSNLAETYLTFNLTEGVQYTVSEIHFEGEFPEGFDVKEWEHVLRLGDIFSKKRTLEIAKGISDRLGDLGYAFAQVNPVPTLNTPNRQVALTFYINPGRKVLVRNIEFLGNSVTNDLVFRERLTYVERSLYSRQKLEDSKIRFQRLAFLGDVREELAPVPGSPDLVDVKYHLTEKSANQVTGSIAYSELDKVFFTLGTNVPNLFGTGNILNFSSKLSRAEKNISISFVQPYWTQDGVERSFSVHGETIDNSKRNLANYSIDAYGFDMGYGVPVALDDAINFSVGYDHTALVRPRYISSSTVNAFIDQHGSEYTSYVTGLGWSKLSTNQAYFPNDGVDAHVRLHASTPGSDLTWYKVNAHSAWYFPLWFDNSAFSIVGNAQYGNGYGKTERLPFFQNFYGGGWGGVRGFEEGSFGPKDQVCEVANPTQCYQGNSLGGNLNLSLNFNLYLPVFVANDTDRKRFLLFADIGNVYDTYSVPTTFSDENLAKTPNFKNLRYSVGVGFAWASPMGNIGFSFSKPFNVQKGDDPRTFQFTIQKTL